MRMLWRAVQRCTEHWTRWEPDTDWAHILAALRKRSTISMGYVSAADTDIESLVYQSLVRVVVPLRLSFTARL